MPTEPSNDVLTKLLEVQREQLTWTRFLARKGLEESLRSVLKDSRHQTAYELSDGEHTQTQIGQQAGLDQSTISELWKRWRRMGLLRDDGGRPRHMIALTDLGWDVPLPKTPLDRAKGKKSPAAEPSPMTANDSGGEPPPAGL